MAPKCTSNRRSSRRSDNNRRSYEEDFSSAADDLQHAIDSLASSDPRPFLHVVSAFVAIGRNHRTELPAMSAKLDELRTERNALSNAVIVGVAHFGATAADRAYAQSLVDAMSAAELADLPSWLLKLDQATASRAVSSCDVWHESSACSLQLDIEGYPVTLTAGFDNVEGYLPSGGSAFDMTHAELAAEFYTDDPNAGDDIDVAPSVVALRLATGLIYEDTADEGAAEGDVDVYVAADERPSAPWPDVRPLFEWAIRLAGPFNHPADAQEDAFVSVRRIYDPDFEDLRHEVDTLAAKFRASRFGRAASAAGADVHDTLEDLIWFGVSDGHARPLSWGKWRVFRFLVHWAHEMMLQGPDQVVLLPDLLRLWVEFAHECEGLPESQSELVLHEVNEVAPLFRAQLDARVEAMFKLLEDVGLTDELIEAELS